MIKDISVEELLYGNIPDAVRILNEIDVEKACALLQALEGRTSAAISGFNADHRPAVDRMTSILMQVRWDLRLESRIKLLCEACYYYKQIGYSFEGIPRGLVARNLAKSHGFTNLERLAETGLGTAYLDASCFQEACDSLERSLFLAHKLGEPILVCLAITNAAALLKEMGLYQEAIDVADKALSFDVDSPRGRYLAFTNAINGLFSAHRLRDDEAALRYLRIGSEMYDDNPLADIVLKTNFEYCRAMYLLFRQDSETAELLIGNARVRAAGINNPRVDILLDTAAALCHWASRDYLRERSARKQLFDLYHRSKQARLYHDHVLRALMEVHSRTLTGEIENLDGENFDGMSAFRRIVSETAKTGMRYAKELVEYTAGTNPGKEFVEHTTNVKQAKFYRQMSDREAARKNANQEEFPVSFDPFAGVHRWLDDDNAALRPVREDDDAAPLHGEVTGSPRKVRKHDELTAIHGDLAKMRIDSLKAAMRTAAYDVAENWALAAEFFDDQTGQHCFRVGRLAGLLAAEIGMDREYCVRIEHASRLHDIGKIAVNEMILMKPGPLDSSEVTAMRAHTEVGAQLLEGSADETLKMAAQIAKYHHAWWNGEGYPNASGDSIPLSARICAFADVYDALTNERPYKRAWPHKLAVEQMMCESGIHFDPRLMRPFLKVLERHIGSAAQPPSTQLHLQEMQANGLLTSRRRLMDALNAA